MTAGAVAGAIVDLGDDCWLESRIVPDYLKMDNHLFEEIWELHPEEKSKIKIFGKIVTCPRYSQNYGADYKFSGKFHEGLPIDHFYMKKIMEFVKKDSGIEYNQLLINWYADGTDYIGLHSDDEPQIVKDSNIYSFSFGQEREFVIKAKHGDFKKVFIMKHNTVIIMGGKMQQYYKHTVPKRTVKTVSGKRINITVRILKT